MFAQYKRHLLLTSIAFLSSTSAAEGVHSIAGGCDSGGECSAIFDRSDVVAQAFCPEGTTIAAWRKDHEPILLQCQSDGTSEENRSYLLRKKRVFGLNYGRYVKLSYIKKHPAEAIQDKFSKTSLCTPAEEDSLRAASFVLLKKRPNQRSTDYCYEITYLSSFGGEFHLVSNHTPIERNNKEYFLPPTGRKTQRDIEELVRQLRLWQTQQQRPAAP